MQGEKRKERWLDIRREWEQDEIQSFQNGPVYSEGPYRQWVGYIELWEENWRDKSWDDYTGPQVQYRAFTGESEACDSPQGGSNSWDGPMGEPMGEGEAWDGPQIEQDEPINEPIDQYYSSYNQKKPLIAFGGFLTYNPCRQRNRKAN
jgi:hypothetical protein